MKPLRDIELAGIASDLQSLVGAQLQEAQQTETEIGLAFYHDRQMVWLWFDLDPRRPLVLRFEDNLPISRAKQIKPLLLFVRAHLIGRRLQAVAMNVELGRVLEFDFHDPAGEVRRLEARLFPHGLNMTVVAGEKSLSLNKPKDVPSKPVQRIPDGASASAEPARSWNEVRDEWLALKQGTARPANTGTSKDESDADRAKRTFEKALQKKTQALEKMRADIEAKGDPIWRQAGDWLKTSGIETAPEKFQSCLDPKKSLAWNIENCFSKAKENERKIEGTKQRLRILETELADMIHKGPEGFRAEALKRVAAKGSPGANAKTLLEKSGARGRKFQIGDDLEAYIGKSAADNLALLRRAQPHDYWMHLRDYPGAHAIVRRPKNRTITDKEFNDIGRWVVIQSLHKSEAELADGKYDLVLAECRHVRPIKGDKLGRVQFQNDRLFVVRF